MPMPLPSPSPFTIRLLLASTPSNTTTTHTPPMSTPMQEDPEVARTRAIANAVRQSLTSILLEVTDALFGGCGVRGGVHSVL